MNKSPRALEQHFLLPYIRQAETSRPFAWLRMGWNDLRENLTASLTYGAAFAILGHLILTYAMSTPYLFTAAISGFLLIGPIAAAGVYEISRRHSKGERGISFADSLKGLARRSDDLFYFGAFLAVTLIGWERISAILFALFYRDTSPNLAHFFRDVFLSGQYTDFVVAYLAVGAVLAAVVFTLSAIAIPMLMDRDIDPITAAMTSLKAASVNPGAMIVWAALVVLLTMLGFATLMLGMIILLPLLGHASWHAYRDMVE